MSVDWVNTLHRLQAYPPGLHRFLPPCPAVVIESVQADLGKIPEDIVGMLKCFNGAELFVKTGPMVSIFRVTSLPPFPPLEWAPDWCIDKFTAKWRSSGTNRQHDWAIAMTNYGGLIVMRDDGTLREWDTAQRIWGATTPNLGVWFEGILREGDAYMKEV